MLRYGDGISRGTSHCHHTHTTTLAFPTPLSVCTTVRTINQIPSFCTDIYTTLIYSTPPSSLLASLILFFPLPPPSRNALRERTGVWTPANENNNLWVELTRGREKKIEKKKPAIPTPQHNYTTLPWVFLCCINNSF